MDKNFMWLLQSIIEGFGPDQIVTIDLGNQYSNFVDVKDGDKIYRFEISAKEIKKPEEEERAEY